MSDTNKLPPGAKFVKGGVALLKQTRLPDGTKIEHKRHIVQATDGSKFHYEWYEVTDPYILKIEMTGSPGHETWNAYRGRQATKYSATTAFHTDITSLPRQPSIVSPTKDGVYAWVFNTMWHVAMNGRAAAFVKLLNGTVGLDEAYMTEIFRELRKVECPQDLTGPMGILTQLKNDFRAEATRQRSKRTRASKKAKRLRVVIRNEDGNVAEEVPVAKYVQDHVR